MRTTPRRGARGRAHRPRCPPGRGGHRRRSSPSPWPSSAAPAPARGGRTASRSPRTPARGTPRRSASALHRSPPGRTRRTIPARPSAIPAAAVQLIQRPPNSGAKQRHPERHRGDDERDEPGARYCSPHETPPLPNSSRQTPMIAAERQCANVSRSSARRGDVRTRIRSRPAMMKRAPDMSNAGMVSIAMWIVRYVDPQIT